MAKWIRDKLPIEKIIKLYLEGVTPKDLADRFSTSRSTIYRIITQMKDREISKEAIKINIYLGDPLK